jgi:hypothetical protein
VWKKVRGRNSSLMFLEANILENQENTIDMVVLEMAGTMAAAKYFNHCPSQILAGEESQRSKRESTFYYRFMSSAYKRSSSRFQVLEETHVLDSYFVFTICG